MIQNEPEPAIGRVVASKNVLFALFDSAQPVNFSIRGVRLAA
jgi:hypothetical protein